MAIPIFERATEAARLVSLKAGSRRPRAAVILGSGLGGVADSISDPEEVPFAEIPYFVESTVAGHDGRLIIGGCNGVDVVVMKGRVHFYEGYSMEDVTLPIRVFALLGIRCVILTNAAGSTSFKMGPGSLMVITDHINLMGDNPLRGPNDERFGPRFPDLTGVYTPAYVDQAHEVARELGLTLAEGVYGALRGPCYETPAEIRMLRDLGVDAVGMSTVPEAIVARHCGMKVLAISCITNVAAGLTNAEINHDEVIEIGKRAGQDLARLIVHVVPRLIALEIQP